MTVAARIALWVLALVVASPGFARDDRVVEGYDALWRSRPQPAFTIADEKPLGDPQTVDGHAFRAWSAAPRGGGRATGALHRVAWLGDDLGVDHRQFRFSNATVFPGEPASGPGADARLCVGARDVCVQGTPPSASGTAQRHVHVTVVVDAFGSSARRYDLPSLFGSCLALTHDGRRGLGFPAGAYHTPEGVEVSDGVDFQPWRLRDGRFVRTSEPLLSIRFVDPQDVYRFRVLAP